MADSKDLLGLVAIADQKRSTKHTGSLEGKDTGESSRGIGFSLKKKRELDGATLNQTTNGSASLKSRSSGGISR